jgi:hypothetical protein
MSLVTLFVMVPVGFGLTLWLHKDNNGKLTNLVADIEGLHHTAPVWEDDPMTFKPERWQGLAGMDTKGYMPFGESPFRCPARQHKKYSVAIPFGVTMIAVLTGCFVEAMGDEWCLNEQDIPPVSEPLRNGREDYDKVALRRTKPSAVDIAPNNAAEPEKTAAKAGAPKADYEEAKAGEETEAGEETKIEQNDSKGLHGEGTVLQS